MAEYEDLYFGKKVYICRLKWNAIPNNGRVSREFQKALKRPLSSVCQRSAIHYLTMTYKKIFLPLAALILTFSLAFQSCNSDSESYNYNVIPSSVGVNSFQLQANAKVLTGLDSVFFSIDLDRALIFNADSLPKGTRIDALIPIMTFPSSVTKAKIIMQGGSKREGEVEYTQNSTDSIDFSGKVYLEVVAYEGNSRLYEIKVNVHTTEPDSLWWGNTALSTLPSRLNNPVEQRTLNTSTEAVKALIQESDGTFTFSSCDNSFSNVWDKRTVTFPFKPQVRSLTYSDSVFYILDEKGNLYSSADGISGWEATGNSWESIAGVYDNTLIGISRQGSSLNFESYPAGKMTGAVPTGFPVKGASQMLTLNSKWWQRPYAVLYGGEDSSGNLLNSVWSYDGSRWAQISNGGLPALTGAALIPYFAFQKSSSSWNFDEYSVLMMLGGKDDKGNLNRDMYVSYDNGVFWSKASELMQLPEFIPGMYDLDAIVASAPMSANIEPKGWTTAPESALPAWYRVAYQLNGYDIEWECPYIYLYGGRNSSDELYNTIWRGVIRRLTFTPLI